jgi:hypothetical protein
VPPVTSARFPCSKLMAAQCKHRPLVWLRHPIGM